MINGQLEIIKEYLKYEPDTGNLIWVKSPSKRAKVGDVAGHKNLRGYIEIRLNGVLYLGHRLVWFLCSGSYPDQNIDHVDGNPSNNRFENLRLCSQSQNIANSKLRVNNTSGYKGVVVAGNKWKAQIKDRCIGVFSSKEEAALAYNTSAKHLFGEFALLNEVYNVDPT